MKAATLSVGSNVTLLIIKLFAGLVTGSISVLSEAIHSGMDLVASLIAFFAVRHADVPPDSCHPYGHEKIENVSGVVEAMLVILAAVWIVIEAVDKLIHPSQIDHLYLAIIVMLTSALVNLFVSNHLYQVAKAEESIALEADALHLKADVITSGGVGLAILLIYLMDHFFHISLHWLDPLIAIGLALFILKEAIEILLKAFSSLIDHSLNSEEIATIQQAVQAVLPQSADYHDLRTRRAGSKRHIDFHLTLPTDMTVAQSHAICDQIERSIESKLPNTLVLIHVEPQGHA